jgi:P27 family predicted phage terminase small subunit
MPGPRAQPTALRVLRGNPGKRKINRAEPQHETLAVECPAMLANPIARAEWDRVAPGLIATGQVTTIDRALLIGYCQKWAQWQALEAAAQPLIVKGPHRKPIANPALSLAFKAFNLMIRAAAELGMTPSARSKVTATPPAVPGASIWADVLK